MTHSGAHFGEDYRDWCDDRGARPRFGALGQHGSIAIVERFMRTLKQETFQRILVPFRLDRMWAEPIAYVNWYNKRRVHQSLRGGTPAEILAGRPAAWGQPRFETRAQWPLASRPLRASARSCGWSSSTWMDKSLQDYHILPLQAELVLCDPPAHIQEVLARSL